MLFEPRMMGILEELDHDLRLGFFVVANTRDQPHLVQHLGVPHRRRDCELADLLAHLVAVREAQLAEADRVERHLVAIRKENGLHVGALPDDDHLARAVTTQARGEHRR